VRAQSSSPIRRVNTETRAGWCVWARTGHWTRPLGPVAVSPRSRPRVWSSTGPTG
jgi:hypothetical protein